MKIEMTMLEERPDGSATLTLNMDHEGTRFLINLGLVTALKEAIDNHKELEPYESEDSNEVSGC